MSLLQWPTATQAAGSKVCWPVPSLYPHLLLFISIQNTGSLTIAPSFSITIRRQYAPFLSISIHLTTSKQCILDDIRAHRIPVDFLDIFESAKVPFYDGTPLAVHVPLLS